MCSSGREPNFVPTRLLDLSQWRKDKTLRLTRSREQLSGKAAYIALSHRWYHKVTATSTTRANVADRYEKIDFHILPSTFTDAVEAALYVNVKYLWIDSICIIQDDPVDWSTEAALMSEVYRNAYCTFSASLVCTEATGMFRLNNMNNIADIILPDMNQGFTTVRFFQRPVDAGEVLEASPLQQRGWCFQERELFPRMVHWTDEQILWECRELSSSESCPTSEE